MIFINAVLPLINSLNVLNLPLLSLTNLSICSRDLGILVVKYSLNSLKLFNFPFTGLDFGIGVGLGVGVGLGAGGGLTEII